MEHLDLLKGVILPYANFIIFVGLAIFFMRKPLAGMARKRHDVFQHSLQEAQKAFDEALTRMNDIQARLGQLDKEIDEIRQRAREQAERESKDMIEEARQVAEHLQEEAKRIAEAEVSLAKAALRREVVEQVKKKIEDELKSGLDAAHHRKIVQQRISELKGMKVEV